MENQKSPPLSEKDAARAAYLDAATQLRDAMRGEGWLGFDSWAECREALFWASPHKLGDFDLSEDLLHLVLRFLAQRSRATEARVSCRASRCPEADTCPACCGPEWCPEDYEPRWDRSKCRETVCYCHDNTAKPFACCSCGCGPSTEGSAD